MAAPIVVNIFVTSLDEVMPIPLKEWAKKDGRAASTLRGLAEKGDLPGAEKRGNAWFINPVAYALSSIQTPHAVTSADRGKKSKRGGDVLPVQGRGLEAGAEGSSGPGTGGWPEIDI